MFPEQEIQLTTDQIKFLKRIYYNRQGLIFSVGFFLPVILFMTFLNVFRHPHSEDLDLMVLVIGFFGLTALLYGSLWYLYKRRIVTLRKDILDQCGIQIKLPILRKSEFPYVGKYYLFFNHPICPNIQVTIDVYKNLKVGDEVCITVSKNANILINDFREYLLL